MFREEYIREVLVSFWCQLLYNCVLFSHWYRSGVLTRLPCGQREWLSGLTAGFMDRQSVRLRSQLGQAAAPSDTQQEKQYTEWIKDAV